MNAVSTDWAQWSDKHGNLDLHTGKEGPTAFDLRTVSDRLEITDLLNRYARGVDRPDRDALRSVYASDGTDDHGIFAGTADDYADWVLDYVAAWVSAHHDISNVMIDFAQEDLAFSECHWTGWYVIPTQECLVDMVACGRYLDRIERRDGSWKIAHRVCVTDWRRTAERTQPVAEDRLSGRRGRTDLVYDLPNLRLDSDDGPLM